ncbi:hypothetical protein SPRG_01367 [Saprolegnia parasitica CBS 223.65]|uniref:Glyoxalase/fosfomycin resistance/dioxygenase domain-containing protein n=1 Tax=Saprolegnia parasitica (strain CBS 223.65) TaxID=695850 RepID=A0A067CUA7_SAPPC|nr:hypothetical protein SPRG_01367 [Saprolegnia parasitica CBS 223.65]KDO34093.1 hypothetical protein SPRG_01367 [Saprolegnia parasitica CBS 223.65]|eukprot:XP_012194977.1 hypothetical protein SPRG_01367 [Saprolegnia parasitica CBS 223.65]
MRASRAFSSVTRSVFAHAPPSLDHVCIVCKDVRKSITFYERVLGARHLYKDDPNFGVDPAFLQIGSAQVALLPLAAGQTQIRDHNGAHFAMTCKDANDFATIKASLSSDLAAHGTNAHVQFEDYGRQLSLFFSDLDDNILEITHWKTS